MNTVTLNQRDIDFLLYEFLDTESLLSRERYAEHSRKASMPRLMVPRTSPKNTMRITTKRAMQRNLSLMVILLP